MDENLVVGTFSRIMPVPPSDVRDWGDVQEDVLYMIKIYSRMLDTVADNGGLRGASLGTMRALTDHLGQLEAALDIRWDGDTPKVGGGSQTPRAWKYRVC